MASSIEDFINRTAASMNAGIKGKIEDGSFNRLGEGLSEGVNGIAAGMISFIDMAKGAFGKLNEKASSLGKSKQTSTPPQTPLQTPPPPPVQVAASTSIQTPPPPSVPVPPSILASDDFIANLAKEYGLGNDEMTLLCSARLMAQTGLFFANCDGNYSDREHQSIEDFKSMMIENVNGVNRYALRHCFDDIDRTYSLEEILSMTHRLVDNMQDEERKRVISSIDDFIIQVMAAESHEAGPEQAYYERWKQDVKSRVIAEETPMADVPPIQDTLEAPSVFCGQCGQKNPADAAFCCACGAPIQK